MIPEEPEKELHGWRREVADQARGEITAFPEPESRALGSCMEHHE